MGRNAASSLAPGVVLFSLCSHGVAGITTAGDPHDAKWIVQPADYPYFVSLRSRGDCAGAIIGQRHAITAAHCLCEDGDTNTDAPPVLLSTGATMEPSKAFFNPDCMFECENDGPNRCDVAVLEFEEDISDSATPIAVYSSGGEVGEEITILGYGSTGNAADGVCEDNIGKMRRAKNVVTAVEGSPGGVIKYVMDESGGLDLEGMAQDGDSGGPAVITSGGIDYLAGVNSGTSESEPCDWGSVDQFCRLSAHHGFIAKVLDPDDNTIAPHIRFEGSAGAGVASAALGRVVFFTLLAIVFVSSSELQ